MNIPAYWRTVNAPWGKLFYMLLWNHLEYQGKDILDFGSGFGLTAAHLAKKNRVVAVEPNRDMLTFQVGQDSYCQVEGDARWLASLPEKSFDVILCHNVLEYVQDREGLLTQFHRLLKEQGELSLVKHNKLGKVMQKAVFENDTAAAMALLRGEDTISENFGQIREYDREELDGYLSGRFQIDHVYGIRTFFGLQRNEFKEKESWLNDMFLLETQVEERSPFREVAFYHHLLLKKIS